MKKIVILVVLICICSSGLFAQDFWGFGNKTSSIIMDAGFIVVGGFLAAVPLFSPDMSAPPYNICLYLAGGGFALTGIIGLIYDLATSDSDYYAMIKNPIFEHVALNVSYKTVYVGGIWRF